MNLFVAHAYGFPSSEYGCHYVVAAPEKDTAFRLIDEKVREFHTDGLDIEVPRHIGVAAAGVKSGIVSQFTT
tara:strand:+ start:398 stop:613 length:216 start_codon:yes stop_codon:yes gene_type:complete